MSKTCATLIIGVIIITLFMCNSDITNEYYFKASTFSHSNQSFSIVSAYLRMTDFITEAKEKKKDVNTLFKNIVFKPIWNTFAKGSEYAELADSIRSPITNLKELENAITILSSSGVEDIVKKALLKCSKALPGPNTKVYLLAANPDNEFIARYGVAAVTLGSGKILVSINPSALGWKNILSYVIAHEYHHSVWTENNYKNNYFDLLKYLIFEGRADSFANILYPEVNPFWTHAINIRKEAEIWDKMLMFLESKDSRILTMFFAGDQREIPLASGYTIGFHIVQEFIKNNPDINYIKWTDMDAEEILSMSKYNERFIKRK